MGKSNDLKNKKFSRLLVIELYSNNKNEHKKWKCICDCGKEVIVDGCNLVTGNTKSCGCLNIENLYLRNPMKKPEIAAKFIGDLNPMKRPEVIAKHMGDLNPSKRPENRIKASIRMIGNKNPMKQPKVARKVAIKISGKNSRFWKGGIYKQAYCPKWTSELRERIRAFFNYECILCGKNTEENHRQLDCHHIGYDKNVCCNDKPVRFAALCMSCHAKTTSKNTRTCWEYILNRIIDEIYDGKSYYTREEYNKLRELYLD
jgi:hypothetical protein